MTFVYLSHLEQLLQCIAVQQVSSRFSFKLTALLVRFQGTVCLIFISRDCKVVLVLRDFTWTLLENLHHFLNLRNNFRFNAIWHRRSVVALIFCRRLAGSDVTVTPSVTCMDWLLWLYNHVPHFVSSSTALAFVTNMSEKRRSASPRAMQVKNWWKTIGTEEKLHVMSLLEKSERIVDIGCNVRLAHSSVHTVRDNADIIKECVKSGTKVFVCVARLPQYYVCVARLPQSYVCVARLPQYYLNEPYQKPMDVSLIFLLR
jgi:hypothetical protein